MDDGDATGAADRNRSEILQAAAAAFMEHGYAATSIDTVAAELGATKGRIYYYYRSKADLFFDVHREAMLLNLDTVRPIATGPGPAKNRLRRMLVAHATLIMSHLPFQRVATQGVEMHLTGSTTPAQRQTLRQIIEMRDGYERLFLAVLQEGIETAEFRAFEPRVIVKPLLGALNWMTVWYRPRPDETEEERAHLANEYATFLISGIDGR